MRVNSFFCIGLSIVGLVACNSSSDGGSPSGTGGATDASTGTGGASETGGTSSGTGGTSTGTGGASTGTGGTSGGAGGAAPGDSGPTCSTKALTCGAILTASALGSLQPTATGYVETGKLPCRFTLPSQAGGIFQVFCGDASLLTRQFNTAQTAYPGSVTETDTIGTKSFEVIVGPPNALGSSAEVVALTTSGKYVFDVSLTSAAADIVETRKLAEALDTSLSAL